MTSIIIPIYNEEKILLNGAHYFKNISQYAELIFVDGGSRDRGIEIAKPYGKVLSCPKGRAIQMNHGAKHATHEILFFLHADNKIGPNTLLKIENKLNNEKAVGGCLTQRIDKEGLIYRIIEAQGNIRARLSKIFYGDQGIFVRKDIFFKLSGFPQVPIMEDVLFSKKLKKIGKTVVLPDKIIVSARRWERKGIIKTTLRYNLINLAFKIGVPSQKISLLYEDIR